MTAAAAGRAASTGTTVRSAAASTSLAERQAQGISEDEWARMQAPAETVRGVAKPVPPAKPARTPRKPAQSQSKPRSFEPAPSVSPTPAAPQATTGGGLQWPNLPRGSSRTETAGGFVLGLLFWAWVALPYLKGGMPEVRKTIKAKFTNKAPDGSWLP